MTLHSAEGLTAGFVARGARCYLSVTFVGFLIGLVIG